MRSILFVCCILAFNLILGQSPVEYLNSYRVKSGLIPLEENPVLSASIKDHTRYMYVNGLLEHKEKARDTLFTGRTADARAINRGYHCRFVAENLAYNAQDSLNAVDELLSTVYHRLSLLDFRFDQVGYASTGHYYGFVLGNSYLDSICAATKEDKSLVSFLYVVNLCDNFNKKVDLLDYLDAIQKVEKQNASIVTFPYPGQDNVPTYFSEEDPKPRPKCNIMGYPVSVQFNEYYHSGVKLISFKLRNSKGKRVKAKLLTPDNDPNKILLPGQYVLIPDKVLNLNETYKAFVVYRENGERFSFSWTFHTQAYQNLFVLEGEQTVYVPTPSTFYVYVRPLSCEDSLFSNLDVKYTTEVFDVGFVNSLVLKVFVKGKDGQFGQILMPNGYNLKVIIIGD